MNIFLWIGIIIFSLVVISYFFKRFGFSSSKGFVSVNSKTFAEKSVGHTIIDVRTNGEYARGHIVNAKSFSLSTLPKKATRLSKDKPVFVYCQSGARSISACKFLSKNGFTNVYNLRGGISSWSGKITR